VSWMAVSLVLASFLFFFPVWFGLPLRPDQFYARMWFRPTPTPLFCFSPQACERAPLRLPPVPGLNWI
jgi:dolichyl-phosphate-mannose-protein mannosyltransferase